jgi:hypothetical protein
LTLAGVSGILPLAAMLVRSGGSLVKVRTGYEVSAAARLSKKAETR